MIFVVVQFFGIMPVKNITDRSASNLRFEWMSFRTILAMILFTLVTCFAMLTFYVAVTNSIFDRFSMYHLLKD